MADWLVWGDGALTADVVTSLDTEASAEISTHPVETGGKISDHVLLQPRSVVFEFAQSAQPSLDSELEWRSDSLPVVESRFQPTGLLWLTTAAGEALSAIGGALGFGGDSSKFSVLTLQARDDADRIQDIHDKLLEVLAGAQEVSFSYSGLVLDGYVLSAVRRSQRSGSGGLARFTIEAQHVETVETGVSSLTGGLPTPSILSAIPLLDLGKKGTDAIEESVNEHRSQTASDLGVDVLGGAL